MNKKVDTERAADIRNKLQAIKTVFEMLMAGKKVPKRMVQVALRDVVSIIKSF